MIYSFIVSRYNPSSHGDMSPTKEKYQGNRSAPSVVDHNKVILVCVTLLQVRSYLQVDAGQFNEYTSPTQNIIMIMNSTAYQLSPFAQCINYVCTMASIYLPSAMHVQFWQRHLPTFESFSSSLLAISPPLHAHHHFGVPCGALRLMYEFPQTVKTAYCTYMVRSLRIFSASRVLLRSRML
jgi:hypothetical protein